MPPTDPSEIRRLDRLRALGLLDTEGEALLDHFTELAARATGLPIALISLIDERRQWFKSAIGLPQGMETLREFAFCEHASQCADLFEVEDARQDPRFADNPLVTGEPYIAHYAGAPLVMPGGEFIGTLCVIGPQPGRLPPQGRDLLSTLARGVVSVLLLRESERNLAARARAESALADSEARYRALAEQLACANRRKDEFLAMLAHELRNPLAPISTAVQLLRIAAEDTQRVRRTAELIGRQVAHMTQLVDDLLDVSRVTRGQVRIDHEPVALDEVVRDALEQARPQVEARQHTLQVAPAPQPPLVVRGDRGRLVQVLVNLLNNAAKYTPEGGHLTLSVRAEGQDAVLAVKDDGIGIDAQLLPHVFELFTQARRTPDRSQGGLGLGLALVRSLVALHGGTVTAESAGPGQGSCFTVRLPALAAPGGPAAADAPAARG